MKEIIEIELIPVFKIFPKKGQDNVFKIYSAMPKTPKDQSVVLNEYGCFTIKGKMHELTLEATYKAKIEKVEDKTYGIGYNVHTIWQDIPKTLDEQKEFLSTMMTDLQLQEVYKAYPDQDIIELMKTGQFDYNKVYGFGPIVYERIRKRIMDNLDWQTLFAELGKYGIKYETLKRLVDHFGTAENAINKVKENPYTLTELSGIGFKKADAIAKNMGIPETSPFRIHAGVKHIIQEEQNLGHTYIERDDLLSKCYDFLEIDHNYIASEIDSVEDLYIEDDKISLKKMYDCEKYIAERLVEMLKHSTELEVDINAFLEEEQKKMGITLTEQQKGFFYNFKKYNVNFLVGYAGTGKSQLMKLLINLVKKMNERKGNTAELAITSYRLLSPTGK